LKYLLLNASEVKHTHTNTHIHTKREKQIEKEMKEIKRKKK